MDIPEGIKVKILLINEILNKECMAEGQAKANEEAKAKPLEYAAGPVAQLPIKGMSSGYYLWAADECNCVSGEMVAFLYAGMYKVQLPTLARWYINYAQQYPADKEHVHVRLVSSLATPDEEAAACISRSLIV